MAVVFSTDDVPPRDRFAYWREAVCDSYVSLECNTDAPQRFEGKIELNRLSKISASFVGGARQTVQRRRRDIARDTEASFLVSIQLRAQSLIQQGGREAHLRPGDFALYSSTDPYVLNIPNDFRQLVIQMPRDEVLERLPNADLLTGRAVSGRGRIGRLVESSVTQLIDAIDGANETTLQCLQASVTDLIATGLASLDTAPLSLSHPDRQMIVRAHTFLAENLADPALNRQMLSDAVGLSVRRLSEIFEANDQSIAATIREMRLKKIAAEMIDPRNRSRSINELAIKWGLYNQAQFSRAFRARFDTTPRQYRRAHFKA